MSSTLSFKTVYQWPLKYQAIIFIVVAFFVFLLGCFFDVLSLHAQLTKIRNQEDILKSQAIDSIHKEKQESAEISKLPEMQKALIEWRKQLSSDIGLSELISEILKLGSNNHIIFGVFKPGEPTQNKTDYYPHVNIKLAAVGNYQQLASFVSQVANLPKIVTIAGLRITNENKSDILGQKLADQANAENLLTAEIVLDINLQGKES